MFIRYNQTAKYWEYDTSGSQDGTGPWVILPIDAAQIYNGGLPSSIAYTDRENTFGKAQYILNEPGVSWTNLFFKDRVQPAGKQLWRITNAAQMFFIQALTRDNDTAGNIGPAEGDIHVTRTGDLSTTGGITAGAVSGNVALKTNVNQFIFNQRISNAGGDWPRLTLTAVSGDPDTKVWQILHFGGALSFWALNDAENSVLASASLARTGVLSAVGFESNNHVRAQSGLYDYGRATPIGIWTDFTPTWTGATLNAAYSCRYMIIGKSLFIQFYMNVTFVANNPYFILPAGSTSAAYFGQPVAVSNSPFSSWLHSPTGATYILFYGVNTDVMAAGTYNVSASFCMSIQ